LPSADGEYESDSAKLSLPAADSTSRASCLARICSSNSENITIAEAPPSSSRFTPSVSFESGDADAITGCASLMPMYVVSRSTMLIRLASPSRRRSSIVA